jgi:hypothetical protein
MPSVAHDLLVKNAVLISRGHEAGAHAVRRDRLPDRPGKSRSGSSLLKDLPDSIGIEPACIDCAPAPARLKALTPSVQHSTPLRCPRPLRLVPVGSDDSIHMFDHLAFRRVLIAIH